MNRLVYAVSLVTLIFGCAVSSATLSSINAAEVDRMQATFTNEIAKYDKAHEDAVAAVRDQYSAALVVLERKFTASGALDSVLAVKKEFTRFSTERVLRENDLAGEPVELQSLQRQYIAKFAGLPSDRAAKVVRLAEFYAKSLKTLEENLTKQRQIDDAIEVKRLREAVPSLPTVAAAALVLSTAQPAADATNTVPAAEEAPRLPPAAVATGAVAAARSDRKAPRKYTGTSSGRIRDQFDTYWKAVQRQNLEAAVAIIDPAVVKEQGTQRVENFIRGTMGRLVGNESPNVRVDLRGIEVDAADATATSLPRVYLWNEWHELRPLSWIQTEGDWFIDLHASAPRRGEARRDEPARRDERGRGR